MNKDKAIIGFIGAGGIARSHIYSLNSLKYYYDEIPDTEPYAVCSLNAASRGSFAARYGFTKALSPDEFFQDEKINTVFILGPNKVHYGHFKDAIGMKAVRRIYLEKPVCSSEDEEKAISRLVMENPSVFVQVGFQYLYSAALREALLFWRSIDTGKPVHFDLRYYHSDYLRSEYRAKRTNRLTPAPDGGAMADLGSHALSLLVAFLGTDLRITGAVQAGHYEDVPEGSDLFSHINIVDEKSLAAGSVAASRVSCGTGDDLSLELYAEKAALRYSSSTPQYFEFFTAESAIWSRMNTGSNYKPVTGFPSGHVPPGWLRAMVHAHYVFLTAGKSEQFVPDINHGLVVQRLVRETAEHLEKFRNKIKD